MIARTARRAEPARCGRVGLGDRAPSVDVVGAARALELRAAAHAEVGELLVGACAEREAQRSDGRARGDLEDDREPAAHADNLEIARGDRGGPRAEERGVGGRSGRAVS